MENDIFHTNQEFPGAAPPPPRPPEPTARKYFLDLGGKQLKQTVLHITDR